MHIWFLFRVYEAFPFHLVGPYADGNGDLSSQSVVGDIVHSMIEAATAVHT